MRSKNKYLYNYYSIKKYTNNYYKLIVFKVPKKNSGFEVEKVGLKYKSEKKNDGKLDNNISRAKSRIFEYALCNNFEYFVTLTLDKTKMDRYNLEEFVKKFGQFIRDYRKKYKANVQYLLIPEKHKDGAWHMHGLMKGIPEDHLTINRNGYKDWEEYSKKFGYISLDYIKNKEAVSKYITKYISKSLYGNGVTAKNKKMYYCSRGLKTAEKIKEGTYYSSGNDIFFDYENEYVKIKVFRSLEELPDFIKYS